MRSGKITFPKAPLMSSRIRAHLRNNLVGYIALFCFAMGGTAYATHPDGEKTISSIDIIDDEVFSDDVANDTLAGGGLAAADLQPNSVGSSEVALNSLTAFDLASDSVGSVEVATETLGSSDIGTNAVGTSEVGLESLTSSDLASNSVGSSEVTANSLAGSDIAEPSLTGFDPEAVSSRKYAFIVTTVGASGVDVNDSRSKGIVDADVKRGATGIYCFELGYSPDSVIGGAAPISGLAETDRVVTGYPAQASDCAAGTDATVFLRDISAGGLRNGAFFVQFESK
jgi:hypothetical protein